MNFAAAPNGASKLYPCGRISRRRFLHRAGGGFVGAALGGLWAQAGEIPDARLGPHFAPKAKSVIFLFMCGGVSHIDTFDPKGNKWAGKLIDVTGFGDDTWFGEDGYFHTDAMHVIERIWKDGDNLVWQATIEEPNVLAKPWVMPARLLKPSTDSLEESPKCVESDGAKLLNDDHHLQR